MELYLRSHLFNGLPEPAIRFTNLSLATDCLRNVARDFMEDRRAWELRSKRDIGVIEMIVGLAILTKWTRLGSYVASVWLLAIAINLVSTGMFFDVAVRDVEIGLAAFVLARLTETRRIALSSDTAREQSTHIVAAA